MNEEAVAPARRVPPLFIGFGVFVVLFTVLPTLQVIGLGLLDGFDSELFLLRLGTTCILWLAPVMIVALMAPLFLRDRHALLMRIRIACGMVTLVALGVLVWLFSGGNVADYMLILGVVMVLMTWVNTFVVEKLNLRGANGGPAAE